jgi:uncharacterized protein YndB with AHSA1/START domain
MSPASDQVSRAASQPLVISRSFAAPRALVFKAWSSADHIKRWFSPKGSGRAAISARLRRPIG